MKDVEAKTQYEGGNSLICSLLTWSNDARRENFGTDFEIFAAISAVFGGDVAILGSSSFADCLDSELALKRQELSVGIEDYGVWRSTRSNPDFGVYLAARSGYSKEIALLRNAVEHTQPLEGYVKKLVNIFGTLDELSNASKIYQTLLSLTTSAPWARNFSFSDSLNELDLTLCMAWANFKVRPTSLESARQLMLNNLSCSEALRLLSARAAERAAYAYYKGLGLSVEDVSLSQISSGDDRWKDFDILAGSWAFDVKNARESYSSRDTYVEHCVPKFKLNRRSGADISIVGVFSPYVTSADDIIDGGIACTILGQVVDAD